MNEPRNMNIADVESLALVKSFQELSSTEREMVLAHLGSPEAYERMRTVMLAAIQELDAVPSPRPRPEIQARVRSAMQANSARGRGGTPGILRYRIPLYQAIAMTAIAVVLAVFAAGRSVPSLPPSPDRGALIPRVDTVVAVLDQESLIRHIADSIADVMSLHRTSRTSHGSSVVAEKRSRPKGESIDERVRENGSSVDAATLQPNRFVGLENLSLLEWQRRGRNMVEDSALLRFTSRVTGVEN